MCISFSSLNFVSLKSIKGTAKRIFLQRERGVKKMADMELGMVADKTADVVDNKNI